MTLTPKKEFIINNRFKFVSHVGSGACGDLFIAVDLSDDENVALKIESKKAYNPILKHESVVYQNLRGGAGIPRTFWFGNEGNYTVMAMELLGPSIDDLFNVCSRRFTLKTVLLLADQMIAAIEFVHSKNYVHRDIKLDNLLMGRGRNSNVCYLIDFGIAKRYRDDSGVHISFAEDKGLIGTARFASVNSHLGYELGRRDDLESLAYVLLFLARGSLPWHAVTATTKKIKNNKIGEKKMRTSVAEICHGCPEEFAIFLNYCRGLRFDEEPNYVFMRRLFQLLFHKLKFERDNKFDWIDYEGKLEFKVKAPKKEKSDLDSFFRY